MHRNVSFKLRKISVISILYQARIATRPLEIIIVEDDYLLVLRQMHVALDHVNAVFLSLLENFERVLRTVTRATAMRHQILGAIARSAVFTTL